MKTFERLLDQTKGLNREEVDPLPKLPGRSKPSGEGGQ